MHRRSLPGRTASPGVEPNRGRAESKLQHSDDHGTKRTRKTSPGTMHRRLARNALKRQKKKAERLHDRFPRKVNPMNMPDAEVPQKGEIPHRDPGPSHGIAQGERTEPQDVRHKERIMKVERWEAEKERIESQYTNGKWRVATFHQRFMELVTWLVDRPLEGVVHPAAAPWPVFKKPNLIEPEDLKTEEVEWFLRTLGDSTDPKTFVSHLKNLRIRFHPDKWRADFLKLEDTEERRRWERALLNTSQVISVMYNERN